MITEEPIPHLKLYIRITCETLLSFCLASFCLGAYFTHTHHDWFVAGLMIMLFLFVCGTCIKRIIDHFSIAAIMLIIPIAPLAILIIAISLIQLLQIL